MERMQRRCCRNILLSVSEVACEHGSQVCPLHGEASGLGLHDLVGTKGQRVPKLQVYPFKAR